SGVGAALGGDAAPGDQKVLAAAWCQRPEWDGGDEVAGDEFVVGAIFVMDVDEVVGVADGIREANAAEVVFVADFVVAEDTIGLADGGEGAHAVEAGVFAAGEGADEAKHAKHGLAAADIGVGLGVGGAGVGGE